MATMISFEGCFVKLVYNGRNWLLMMGGINLLLDSIKGKIYCVCVKVEELGSAPAPSLQQRCYSREQHKQQQQIFSAISSRAERSLISSPHLLLFSLQFTTVQQTKHRL